MTEPSVRRDAQDRAVRRAAAEHRTSHHRAAQRAGRGSAGVAGATRVCAAAAPPAYRSRGTARPAGRVRGAASATAAEPVPATTVAAAPTTSHGEPSSLVAGRDARPVLRLTRRGRVVLLLILSALLLGAFSIGRVSSSAAGHRVAQRVVVVHPGDTLWSIAQHVAPGSDPREVVARIADANGLPTSDVRVGQQLVVPRD
jgi:nucleoid-associated protein YgaU